MNTDQEKLQKKAYRSLKTVIDPELGVNIVDLGLIYEVKVKSEKLKVKSIRILMTLTTPGCPLGGWFVKQIKEVVGVGVGIEEENVIVEVVFDPPWTTELMSEEVKAQLGFD